MTDQLPEVELTPEQEERAADLHGILLNTNERTLRASRLIVHMQDQLAKPAHEREPPHCSNCSCGMPAEPPGDAP